MSVFEYNETHLYYEIHGVGIPVLLIHGWGIDHHFLTGCMEPVFDLVPDQFSRYYIDLPGMGASDPGNVRNTSDILNVLTAFIHNILKNQPFLLAGNSYGGMLSRLIALNMPELVLGMILICPATGAEERVLAECTVFKEDKAFMKSLNADQEENFRSMNVILTRVAWDRYEQDIYRTVLAHKNNTFLHQILDGSLPSELYHALAVSTYKKPVLLLTGKQDCCVGYLEQFEWLECYPAATYLALENAGHNLTTDQPKLFSDLVIAWLRENYLSA